MLLFHRNWQMAHWHLVFWILCWFCLFQGNQEVIADPKKNSPKNFQFVLNLIENFSKTNTTMSGKFTLLEGSRKSYGKFFSKQPKHFKLFFSGPKRKRGEQIISNGNLLWFHIPKQNIIIEQTLKEIHPVGLSSEILGIRKLILNHNYRIKNQTISLKKMPQSKIKTYLLELKAPDHRYGFQNFKVYVRMDGCIVKTMAKNAKGYRYQFTRHNIILNPILKKDEFARIIPKNSQVFKNPFTSMFNH